MEVELSRLITAIKLSIEERFEDWTYTQPEILDYGFYYLQYMNLLKVCKCEYLTPKPKTVFRIEYAGKELDIDKKTWADLSDYYAVISLQKEREKKMNFPFADAINSLTN